MGSAPLTRSQLLSRSAKGGAALVVAGSGMGALAGPAGADTAPDGAYIGGVDAVETVSLRLPPAQAAANEAQHLSVFATALDRRPIGLAFAPALSIDRATLALDPFES